MIAEPRGLEDGGREINYRRVSGWAIAGAVTGILSGAAVVGPILWLIPVFGMVISTIGLLKIRNSQGQISGWGIAVLGLLLSIFFGAAGPTRTLTRRFWLETRAQLFAQQFIDLLQENKPFEAHQLTRVAAVRRPFITEEPDPYAKDADAKKDYDRFIQLEPVKFLLTHQQSAKVKLLSSNYAMGDERTDIVAVVFQFAFPEKADSKPFDELMYVERTLAYGSQTEQWRIVPPALRLVENNVANPNNEGRKND